MANKIGAVKVTVNKENPVIILKDINAFEGGGLNFALNAYKNAVLSFEANPVITLTERIKDANVNLNMVIAFIRCVLENQKQ